MTPVHEFSAKITPHMLRGMDAGEAAQLVLSCANNAWSVTITLDLLDSLTVMGRITYDDAKWFSDYRGRFEETVKPFADRWE